MTSDSSLRASASDRSNRIVIARPPQRPQEKIRHCEGAPATAGKDSSLRGIPSDRSNSFVIARHPQRPQEKIRHCEGAPATAAICPNWQTKPTRRSFAMLRMTKNAQAKWRIASQTRDDGQLKGPSLVTCARESIRMTSDSSLRGLPSNRRKRFVIARERQRTRQSAFVGKQNQQEDPSLCSG